MKHRSLFMMSTVVLLSLSVGTAVAQDCPCDCYFSGDCNPGMTCNWGSLPVEDSCFWRTPKPQGNVGAGCTEDYNNWGQCDGICSGSLQGVGTPFDGHTLVELTSGVAALTQGFIHAANEGDDTVDSSILDGQPQLRDDLLRVLNEIALMLSPGVVDYGSGPVPLIRAPADDRALVGFELASQALLAEIDQTSGIVFIEQIPADLLDNSTLQRICQGDHFQCLAGRIHDLSKLFVPGEAGDSPQRYAQGGPCSLFTCSGDINDDDVVDAADLAFLLGNWGACAACRPDLDGNGAVDAADLALLLGQWGACGQ